ncbi:DMT family transporter [Alphaproteobacteria bacterium]|nr:DMT family transporter [Alphaproteobacteria bacterium]
MDKKFLFAFFLLLISSLFWSGNFFSGKLAYNNNLTPFKLSFLRWFIAFIILFPFTILTIIKDFNIYKKNIILITFLSILGITIFNSFTYIALKTTLVINASIMGSIAPLLILGFSWIVFKTKTNLFQFFGIFLSLLGVFFIILKGNIYNLLSLYFTPGDLWMFIAVLCWGLYSVLLKKIDKKLSQLPTLEVMIFIGLIFIFPFYLFESIHNDFFPNKALDYYIISYVAIFAGICAFFAWNKGVSLIGANRAGLFLNMIPVFSSIWAITFLDEAFSFFHLIGAIFIVSGIILSNIKGIK